MGKQRRGGRGDLHAYLVDALLHHAIERLGQLVLLQVMLILPDADGFRVDLDQLGQRVLHPAGDGDRAALGHVEIGEFLGGQLARGID